MGFGRSLVSSCILSCFWNSIGSHSKKTSKATSIKESYPAHIPFNPPCWDRPQSPLSTSAARTGGGFETVFVTVGRLLSGEYELCYM